MVKPKVVVSNPTETKNEIVSGNIFDFGKKSLIKEIEICEKKLAKLEKKITSNDEILNKLKHDKDEMLLYVTSLKTLKQNTGIN